jgi:hypothetical protein
MSCTCRSVHLSIVTDRTKVMWVPSPLNGKQRELSKKRRINTDTRGDQLRPTDVVRCTESRRECQTLGNPSLDGVRRSRHKWRCREATAGTRSLVCSFRNLLVKTWQFSIFEFAKEWMDEAIEQESHEASNREIPGRYNHETDHFSVHFTVTVSL